MPANVFLPSARYSRPSARLARVDAHAPDRRAEIQQVMTDDLLPVLVDDGSSVLIDFESTWFSQAAKVP